MQDGHSMKRWARTVVILAAALVAISQFRAPATGLDLAITERGLAFELKSGFINIAFDIGRMCPISNSAGRLV